MNGIRTSILSVILLIGTIAFAQDSNVYHKDRIVLKVKPAYKGQCRLSSFQLPQLSALYRKANNSTTKQLYPKHKGTSKLPDLSTVYEIKLPEAYITTSLLDSLMATGFVEYVERVPIRQLHYLPNDPLVVLQDFMEAIHAYEAWDVAQADQSVCIGIIDSGGNYLHPDMENNLRKNENDPINGIDDDNDGYIDNYLGWDFGENDNDPIIDDNSFLAHGALVSALAAAQSDNGIGVSSPAFNASYMLIKVTDSQASLWNTNQAIVYAADMGCDIINCSWGSSVRTQAEEDAVVYATAKGALIVAAAGNVNHDTAEYPAAFDQVLGVASIDAEDKKANFSNYGSWVNIAAPGIALYSAYTDELLYYSKSGTSGSCPIVASAAALLKYSEPDLGPLEIKTRLEKTSDPLNTTQALGGKLNLFRALTESGTGNPVISSLKLHPNPAHEKVELVVDLKESGFVEIRLKNNVGQDMGLLYSGDMRFGLNSKELDMSSLRDGLYFIEVKTQTDRRIDGLIIVN